jgi:hypothetical protein
MVRDLAHDRKKVPSISYPYIQFPYDSLYKLTNPFLVAPEGLTRRISKHTGHNRKKFHPLSPSKLNPRKFILILSYLAN